MKHNMLLFKALYTLISKNLFTLSIIIEVSRENL